MKLAFIGLGNMGLPMASNLLKAGYEVYGINRSKGREELFAQVGGKVGLTVRELVGQVDVIMTCLPMPADVEKVYLGPDGIVNSGRKGLTLIDFSTVSSELSVKMASAAEQAGMNFLDAPVSGGTTGAEQATLSIMVGGSKQIFDRMLPVLEKLGKNLYHVGDIGSGTVVKLLNQLMVGIHTQAASEAMILADKMNLPKHTLHRILSESFAQSRIYDRHYTHFVQKDQFQPGFALSLLHKDMALVKKMADESGAVLPIGAQVERLLGAAKVEGFGDKDMSGMYAYLKENGRRFQERKYFAVFLPMKDAEKSQIFLPQHLAYLEEQRNMGRLFANGRFGDEWGGLVVYIACNEEEVRGWVSQDPYFIEGARDFEIHEWDLVKGHVY
ncbi:NAD(P)-binding domain-containing protein [Paenibacillus hamazuiensis]|uniref:NAD(P)-binding domain-containing protein n=1 Tax=Paenibacillus hamazuiensis TaxID=2936508 RepID=UPI00200BDA97|nr:NAD(P)-binding domain-containing protein [Paenibacillus hamazuiensis]